jgi:hypothetical protein
VNDVQKVSYINYELGEWFWINAWIRVAWYRVTRGKQQYHPISLAVFYLLRFASLSAAKNTKLRVATNSKLPVVGSKCVFCEHNLFLDYR